MFTWKNGFLFLAAVGMSSCGNVKIENLPCQKTKENCLNDPNCQCWCSQKCGYRAKKAEDHLVFVENDPNGKSCYCKQWDADHYEDNCIHGAQIKEAKGAL